MSAGDLRPLVEAAPLDGVGFSQLGVARRRLAAGLVGRERLTTAANVTGFLAAAAALALFLPSRPTPSLPLVLVLAAAFAVAGRVLFEIGSAWFVPTQLVLVPMLLLLPPAYVPALVGCGYAVGGLVDVARGELRPARVLVRVASGWHSIGPALVLGLWAGAQPSWQQLPLYAAALAAQFAFDLTAALGFEWLGHRVRPSEIMPLLGRAYLVDLVLAPLGLAAVLGAGSSGFGFLPVISVVALMRLLARDRKEQIGNVIQATDAYETESVSGRTDELTGLANRRAWEEQLKAADARCATGAVVSVLLVDLDGLKRANDTRGHVFGDHLIKAVATIVRDTVAGDGFVARLGGDEVGVLLPDADEERCAQTIARIREAIAATPQIEGFPLSASIGGASLPPELTMSNALAQADERMYEQKRASKLSRENAAG